MKLKQITKKEYQEWYANSEACFLQAPAWGELKKEDGYEYLYFKWGDRFFQALTKSYPLVGKQAYIPRAKLGDADIGEKIKEDLGSYFGVVLIDPDLPDLPEENEQKEDKEGKEDTYTNRFDQVGHKPIQPQKTLVINAEQTQEEWFKSMRKSTRKEVRRSLRYEEAGKVEIREISGRGEGGRGCGDESETVAGEGEEAEKCAEIMSTQAGKKYAGRSAKYYLRVLKAFGKDAKMLGVYAGDNGVKCLGGSIGIVDKNQGAYRALYSGIQREALEGLNAGYLMKYHQWRMTNQLGLKHLDLWGVEDDPSSEWYNFSRFKLGFGGEVVKYPSQIRVFKNEIYKFLFRIIRG